MTDHSNLIAELRAEADRKNGLNARALMLEAAAALAEVPQPEDREALIAGPTCDHSAGNWELAGEDRRYCRDCQMSFDIRCSRPGALHRWNKDAGIEHWDPAHLDGKFWGPCVAIPSPAPATPAPTAGISSSWQPMSDPYRKSASIAASPGRLGYSDGANLAPAPTCDRPGASHRRLVEGLQHVGVGGWVPCPAETAATRPAPKPERPSLTTQWWSALDMVLACAEGRAEHVCSHLGANAGDEDDCAACAVTSAIAILPFIRPADRPAPPSDAQVLRDALTKIAGPCHNNTSGDCWDEGRDPDSEFTAYRVCDACIARAALVAAALAEVPESKEQMADRIGRDLVILGKAYLDAGDEHEYRHIVAALKAGNSDDCTTSACMLAEVPQPGDREALTAARTALRAFFDWGVELDANNRLGTECPSNPCPDCTALENAQSALWDLDEYLAEPAPATPAPGHVHHFEDRDAVDWGVTEDGTQDLCPTRCEPTPAPICGLGETPYHPHWLVNDPMGIDGRRCPGFPTPAPSCDRPGASHGQYKGEWSHFISQLGPARWVPCPAETAATGPAAVKIEVKPLSVAQLSALYMEAKRQIANHVCEPAPPSDAQVDAAAKVAHHYDNDHADHWPDCMDAEDYRELARAALVAAAEVTE